MSAYIAGSARRATDYSCRQNATLVITSSGRRRQIELQSVTRSKRQLQRNDLDAPDAIRSYSVVDFSPDSRLILLERVGTDSWRNNTYRDVAAQFEKLWGDMTALPEVPSRFVVVPRLRGQQLKDPAQLDGWLRDGSAQHLETLCEW